MNYTALIPSGLFQDITGTKNVMDEICSDAKIKAKALIETVQNVVSSVEFNLTVAFIESASSVTTLIEHANGVLTRQFDFYTELGLLNKIPQLISNIEVPQFLTTLHKTLSVALQHLAIGFDYISTSVGTCINFYSIVSKTQENIEERKSAKLSGDEDKIRVADFKAVALTSDYFKLPQIAVAFLVICGVAIPAIVLTVFAVIAAVGAFFLAANIFINYNTHKITTKLLDELKLERHHSFLNAYYTYLIESENDKDKKAELNKQKDNVPNLSLAETSALKKALKINSELLEDSDKIKAIYHKSLKTANLHFINLLNKKIADDASLIETQFAVPLPKSSEEEIELPTYKDGSFTKIPANLFEKMSVPEFQSDKKKVHHAVKILKIRLEDRILAEKGDLILGSFGLATAVMSLVLALGVFTPLAPVAIAVGLILLVSRVALVIEEEYDRKPKFLAAMEKLTATSSDLGIEDEDLDEIEDLDDLFDLSDEQSEIISESSDE